MPNHFHGIIVVGADLGVVGADLRVCPNAGAYGTDAGTTEGAHPGAPLPEMA